MFLQTTSFLCWINSSEYYLEFWFSCQYSNFSLLSFLFLYYISILYLFIKPPFLLLEYFASTSTPELQYQIGLTTSSILPCNCHFPLRPVPCSIQFAPFFNCPKYSIIVAVPDFIQSCQKDVNNKFVTSAEENVSEQIAISIETGEIQWPKFHFQFTCKHPMNKQICITRSGVVLKHWIFKYHCESCWGLLWIPTSSQSFHTPKH